MAKPVVDTRDANNVKPLKFSNLGNSALIGGISASTSNGNRGGGGSSSSFKSSNPFQMDTNDLAVYLGQVVGRAVIKVRLTGEKLYESSDDEIRQALGSSIAKVLAKNRNNRDFADKLKNMDVQETSDFLAAEIKARVLAVRLTGASLRNADPQEIIDALGNTAGKEVKRLQQEDRDGY